MMKFNICYVAAIVCNGLHIFSNVSRYKNRNLFKGKKNPIITFIDNA